MKSQSLQLKEQGYCVYENLLTLEDLNPIRNASLQAISKLSPDHRERNKSQGSLILIADYPEFSALIGHSALRGIFRQLGFSDPRFSSGYIISKPANGPALFWHQDWWGWDHPSSYTNEVMQVFVMIYLQDTHPENGCLRVIPGSHRTPHPFHTNLEAHAESMSKVEDPEDFHYQSIPEEVPVSVNVGDVIVGDARLIHGSFPNHSCEERTLITLWFHPNFKNLPKAIQARICDIFKRKGVDTDPEGYDSLTLLDWPETSRLPIEYLFPNSNDGVDPHPWCRIPVWPEN